MAFLHSHCDFSAVWLARVTLSLSVQLQTSFHDFTVVFPFDTLTVTLTQAHIDALTHCTVALVGTVLLVVLTGLVPLVVPLVVLIGLVPLVVPLVVLIGLVPLVVPLVVLIGLVPLVVPFVVLIGLVPLVVPLVAFPAPPWD